MGLLDDAIREHLELKRRRGADVAELARQEREAFGPVSRADIAVAEPDDAAHDRDPALDDPAAFAEPAEERPPPVAEPARLHRLVEETEPPRSTATRPTISVMTPRPAPGRVQRSPARRPSPRASTATRPTTSRPRPQPPRRRRPRPTTPDRIAGRGDEPRFHGDRSQRAGRRSRGPSTAVPGEEPPPRPQPTREFDAEELRAASGTPPERVADEEVAQQGDEGEQGEEGEDVLEETPEFLQETPEHDRLWFEQRPPRDFDF